MLIQFKTWILQKVKVRTKWLRERPLQVQSSNGLGEWWLNQPWTYSFLKRFPFPFPGNSPKYQPQISLPIGKFQFPFQKTGMQFFNSLSLPVKRVCDFHFPSLSREPKSPSRSPLPHVHMGPTDKNRNSAWWEARQGWEKWAVWSKNTNRQIPDEKYCKGE